MFNTVSFSFNTDNIAYIILIVYAIVGYLIGNISPATLMGKIHGVDIRKEGSGNPGTTNVLRTLGKKAAACTLAIDILKGVIPVLIGRYTGGELAAYVCGTAAFLGHVWPIRYKFKGGKGIATGFGLLLALDWRVGLICLASAAVFMILTKRVSCGSLAAAIAFPISLYLLHDDAPMIWAGCLAALIIWRHRSNVARIIKGEEPPISFSKKKDDGENYSDK